MQAAEAYTARSRNARRGGGANSANKSGGETFHRFQSTPRSQGGSGVRSGSASPGPNRRGVRRISSSDSTKRNAPTVVTQQQPSFSTQSTPVRRPKDGPLKAESHTGGDDQILKRMEEILMTYKSRVEDKLAAEGMELPKDIFEDFTTQWVAGSVTGNDTTGQQRRRRRTSASSDCSSSATPASTSSRTTPNWRKEFRHGQGGTRIPMPTFYSSPSETNIQ